MRSAMTRDADGQASITTARCASQPTAFLVSERETIPPSAPRCAGSLAKSALLEGYRPRGASAPATSVPSA
jgi:hypothetical protein